jgi:hypothetical protein
MKLYSYNHIFVRIVSFAHVVNKKLVADLISVIVRDSILPSRPREIQSLSTAPG